MMGSDPLVNENDPKTGGFPALRRAGKGLLPLFPNTNGIPINWHTICSIFQR